MLSGSVIIISPNFSLLLSFPQPIPSIAKFFKSSHPKAPTPTKNIFANYKFSINYWPKH